jgi:hypothetical protein
VLGALSVHFGQNLANYAGLWTMTIEPGCWS